MSAAEKLIEEFDSSSLQDSLRNSLDIIAVGTSSCEGPPQEEVIRAKERAIELRRIVKSVTPGGNPFQPFYGLNLGQFSKLNCPVNPSNTANQRRILIVSVISRETNELDPDAVQEVLRTTEISDFSFEGYSQFDLFL